MFAIRKILGIGAPPESSTSAATQSGRQGTAAVDTFDARSAASRVAHKLGLDPSGLEFIEQNDHAAVFRYQNETKSLLLTVNACQTPEQRRTAERTAVYSKFAAQAGIFPEVFTVDDPSLPLVRKEIPTPFKREDVQNPHLARQVMGLVHRLHTAEDAPYVDEDRAHPLDLSGGAATRLAQVKERRIPTQATLESIQTQLDWLHDELSAVDPQTLVPNVGDLNFQHIGRDPKTRQIYVTDMTGSSTRDPRYDTARFFFTSRTPHEDKLSLYATALGHEPNEVEQRYLWINEATINLDYSLFFLVDNKPRQSDEMIARIQESQTLLQDMPRLNMSASGRALPGLTTTAAYGGLNSAWALPTLALTGVGIAAFFNWLRGSHHAQDAEQSATTHPLI